MVTFIKPVMRSLDANVCLKAFTAHNREEVMHEPCLLHFLLDKAASLSTGYFPTLVGYSTEHAIPVSATSYGGISCLSLLQDRDSCTDEMWLAQVIQYAEGLRFMHALGIIHGDTKPGNLVFDRHRHEGKHIGLGAAEPFTAPNWQPRRQRYCSRGYRPYELYLTHTPSTWKEVLKPTVDLVSFGAVVAEITIGPLLLGAGDVPQITLNMKNWVDMKERWACIRTWTEKQTGGGRPYYLAVARSNWLHTPTGTVDFT